LLTLVLFIIIVIIIIICYHENIIVTLSWNCITD